MNTEREHAILMIAQELSISYDEAERIYEENL